ncbi:transcription activator acu-15 [Fusarium agapanthi]|uniref:Transcription activator acu-15 n=1 Tax=Fusarium agapanthi TaxID=1803897 RepID=A0A9P5B235_9HYPO|nr:transcription activator acu-15 [Fusarium agapanthi]
MSHSQAGPSSARPARRRPRGLVACRRCKSRKQRCDNEFPACSNCLAAGEKCSYGAKQAYPAEYVKSLERQISKLQDEIASPRQNVVSPISHSSIQQQTLSMVDTQSGVNETEPASLTETAASDLEASAGIVAPSPDSFLGTSSGYPLTKLLRSALPSSVDIRQSDRAGTSHQVNIVARSLIGVPVDTGQQLQGQRIPDGSDLPSKEVGDKLIEAYYARVHPKHPFLPRKRVESLHEARHELVPALKAVPSGGVTNRCDYATLQLVYAIGARYLQLSNDDNHYSSPKRHYACALADADSIFATGNLESLEAMLLLTIYQLRSPTGPSVWWMIETTMRCCIDNGLHRQATDLPPTLDERRKRIFWTAYMLERSVARTMGRPHSISDRDIDVALPANIDDELDTDEAILAAIVESNQHPAQITALTPAIHIFRLQQIDSKISHTVCRVDKDVSEIKPQKVTFLRQALEEWKAAIPQTDPGNKPHPYLTTDYHMIQYHKAIILLNLPFLPSLTPLSPTFHEIVHSAGQVCSLSKRLHDRQTYISFSLLSLHANFVAGLVMVYCFCLDSSIFSPKFSSSVRACSTMLYIISERWPRAVQARNAFDRLVAATIENEHDENNGLLRTEDDKAGPPPVYFESLGLAVKFGRDETVSVSKGQCLWALGRVLPEVPVPEIYGWSTEDGYVLLYMEMVKGVTVEKRWPSMTEDEKTSFWGTLRSLVSSLRTLSQDPDDQFLGRIDRSLYYDISITNSNRPPAGPFTTIKGFHDWLSIMSRQGLEDHWPGMKPEEIPDPYLEMLPADAQVVFTHADLYPRNIIVSPDSPSTIVALIDWEQSGWYPDYWEFCKAEYTAEFGSEWHGYMLRFLEEPKAIDGFIEYTRALGH